jgi:carbonic anhydrase
MVDNPSSILVLAALFELTSDDSLCLPFLDKIVDTLPKLSVKNANTTLDSIDMSPVTKVFQHPTFGHYAYSGSLTTPPCSEGVKFVIPVNQTFPISVHQFNALKNVIKFNSRYTQNNLGMKNLLQATCGNKTVAARR